MENTDTDTDAGRGAAAGQGNEARPEPGAGSGERPRPRSPRSPRSPRRKRAFEALGWAAACSLTLALVAGVASRPASGVPVHDSSAISKLVSQMSTLGRQLQQLTRTAEIVDGIRGQIGTIGDVADFRKAAAVEDILTDVESLPWLGPAPAPVQQGAGTPVEGRPWLRGRRVSGPRGDELTADRSGDMPASREWAARNFFLPEGAQGAAAARDLEAWREGMSQEAAVEAWAQATAARRSLETLPGRQERIAEALEGTRSLREDVSVLVAAISESTRAVALGNAMAAAQLEIQALAVLRSAPPQLSPGSRSALLGGIPAP